MVRHKNKVQTSLTRTTTGNASIDYINAYNKKHKKLNADGKKSGKTGNSQKGASFNYANDNSVEKGKDAVELILDKPIINSLMPNKEELGEKPEVTSEVANPIKINRTIFIVASCISVGIILMIATGKKAPIKA